VAAGTLSIGGHPRNTPFKIRHKPHERAVFINRTGFGNIFTDPGNVFPGFENIFFDLGKVLADIRKNISGICKSVSGDCISAIRAGNRAIQAGISAKGSCIPKCLFVQ